MSNFLCVFVNLEITFCKNRKNILFITEFQGLVLRFFHGGTRNHKVKTLQKFLALNYSLLFTLQVKNGDDDFGWGTIVNFQKKSQQKQVWKSYFTTFSCNEFNLKILIRKNILVINKTSNAVRFNNRDNGKGRTEEEKKPRKTLFPFK